MVTTQVEQVLKAQDELLNELNSKNNDNAVRVMTRGDKMTQEPLYPQGHPKRIEHDSQRINTDAPSPRSKNKMKTDRSLHASEPAIDTPENPNHIIFLLLRHNQVMNMNLVIMLIMMFMLMVILVMIMM